MQETFFSSSWLTETLIEESKMTYVELIFILVMLYLLTH